MSNDQETKDIDQLMAEADDLIRQIHSDAIKDMKETHRLQFEKHARNFEKIKSAAGDTTPKKGMLDGTGSSTEGTHEAIREIVTAMRDLKKDLF